MSQAHAHTTTTRCGLCGRDLTGKSSSPAHDPDGRRMVLWLEPGDDGYADYDGSKLMTGIIYNGDGTSAVVEFDDGSTEIRHADANGCLDLSDLWFRDTITGEVAQWGEDGAYETPSGYTQI